MSEEDEKLAQNTEGTAASDKPADGSESIDELFGGKETEQQQDTTDKESKKASDFEKGMHKYEELWRQEKARNEEIIKQQAQPPQFTPPVVPQMNQAVDPNLQQGAVLLQDLVHNAVSQAVNPIISEYQQMQENRYLDEFQKKPLVNELAPQIIEETRKMPANMPNTEKWQRAYEKVTVGVLPMIIDEARKHGWDEGFLNRTEKMSQGTMRPTPKHDDSGDDFKERVLKGQISKDEAMSRQQEIQKIYEEDAGIS